jgi:hypothetical protein
MEVELILSLEGRLSKVKRIRASVGFTKLLNPDLLTRSRAILKELAAAAYRVRSSSGDRAGATSSLSSTSPRQVLEPAMSNGPST